MKLCLITDVVRFAREAEDAGIERIMIDLEQDGKARRQAGRGLFLSSHRLQSVAQMKSALMAAALVVRINPLGSKSAEEIDTVVTAGADFVMLPYFAGAADVRHFVDLVARRSGVILLVETGSAVDELDQVLRVPGVDEVHIGLNDLSISLGYETLFAPLQSGIVQRLCLRLRASGIPFGFGGIGRLSHHELPVAPERFLAAQVTAGATRAWLGRSFRGDMAQSGPRGELAREVSALRVAIAKWRTATDAECHENSRLLLEEIAVWDTERRTRLSGCAADSAWRWRKAE